MQCCVILCHVVLCTVCIYNHHRYRGTKTFLVCSVYNVQLVALSWKLFCNCSAVGNAQSVGSFTDVTTPSASPAKVGVGVCQALGVVRISWNLSCSVQLGTSFGAAKSNHLQGGETRQTEERVQICSGGTSRWVWSISEPFWGIGHLKLLAFGSQFVWYPSRTEQIFTCSCFHVFSLI